MSVNINKNEIMIIAEVGQNHNGDLDTARKYIKVFAEHGADVIKFQTRNNKYLFSESAYSKEYNSENAFGDTYGEHREKLELDIEWLPILKSDCEEHGVKFMSTPFDEPSLDVICDVGVDVIKIASFDLGNLPFLKKISQRNIPVVISTGGGNYDVIQKSVDILNKYNDDVTVLHCVSEYPCTHDRLGLNTIDKLIEMFPDCTIGLSDHFSGTLSGPVGYMKGARVFEKHVTLNRAHKGTDQSFSLEPHGFGNFVRDIRRTPEMFNRKSDDSLGKEAVFVKLGKSVVANKDIRSGDIIGIDDLSGKIFEHQYIPVRESTHVIGKKAAVDIKKHRPIKPEDIINYSTSS